MQVDLAELADRLEHAATVSWGWAVQHNRGSEDEDLPWDRATCVRVAGGLGSGLNQHQNMMAAARKTPAM